LAAGPFAEIDEAAAVAAEREVGVGALDRLLTDGAAEFDDSLSRHTISIVVRRFTEKRFAECDLSRTKSLQDFCHQIVVVGFGDLAAIELAGHHCHFFGDVVHEDLAVDLGSVHGSAAFEQQFGFFGLAF